MRDLWCGFCGKKGASMFFWVEGENGFSVVGLGLEPLLGAKRHVLRSHVAGGESAGACASKILLLCELPSTNVTLKRNKSASVKKFGTRDLPRKVKRESLHVLAPRRRATLFSWRTNTGYALACAAGAHTWRMINEPTPDAEATFRRQSLAVSPT